MVENDSKMRHALVEQEEVFEAIDALEEAVKRLEVQQDRESAQQVNVASLRAWGYFLPVYQDFGFDDRDVQRFKQLLERAHRQVKNVRDADDQTSQCATNIKRRACALEALITDNTEKLRDIFREVIDHSKATFSSEWPLSPANAIEWDDHV